MVNDAIRAGRTLAIVDPAPGRSVSSMYRKLVAATPRALYVANPEPRTLRAYEEIERIPFRSAAVALDEVRTVVAVEAPVLERWGPPGLLMRRRSEVQVICAGDNGGVTAELADRCIPMSAVEATIAESEKPALVIGGEHLPWSAHLTLAAMNRDLGAVHVRQEPNEGAAPTRIETVPDGSIEVLIVDGSGVPLKALGPKLRQHCTVIAISASANEYTRMAKFVIAAPAPLEAEADLASPFDQLDIAPRTAEAVVEGGTGVSPRDFFARLKGNSRDAEEQAVRDGDRPRPLQRMRRLRRGLRGREQRRASAPEG